jgi:4-hydroxy-tetrahydrodipicolinate reductase
MPQACNFDEVCRLLASGANVITTRSEFNNPASLDPAVRKRVEDACRRGNASIHSTGISPGFITEAVPLVLTSIQRRLDSLRIHEFADVSSRNSPRCWPATHSSLCHVGMALAAPSVGTSTTTTPS